MKQLCLPIIDPHEEFLRLVAKHGDLEQQMRALMWSAVGNSNCGNCPWNESRLIEPATWNGHKRSISEHCCHPNHAKAGLPKQQIAWYPHTRPRPLRPGWCPVFAPTGESWESFLGKLRDFYERGGPRPSMEKIG